MEWGVLYLAFGPKYKAEVQRSVRSLQKVSPGLPTAVITDRRWDDEPLPSHFLLRPSVSGFACKPLYIPESPFQRTLFLDTDTVVARDIRPVFGLLNHYDIGVCFGGPQLNEPDGLELHTQCNSGVILFRKTPAVDEVFRLWAASYEEYRSHYQASRERDDGRGVPDQRTLAIAIARSKARPVHLAEYLNFFLPSTVITYSPPLIYHGRFPEMEVLNQVISGSWDTTKDWHARLWMQNIRGLLPAGLRRSDPLLGMALIFRRLLNEIRYWCLSRRFKDKT